MESKIVAQAKQNYRDYKIIENFVAGIVLTGNEIKSLRSHQASINEAYILPQQRELYIINMSISAYKYSHTGDLVKAHNTKRKRKLLLKTQEIIRIIRELKTKNYVVIPLKLFFNDQGWAKLEMALAQRLRKYQVKEKVKERDEERRLKKEGFW